MIFLGTPNMAVKINSKLIFRELYGKKYLFFDEKGELEVDDKHIRTCKTLKLRFKTKEEVKKIDKDIEQIEKILSKLENNKKRGRPKKNKVVKK